MTQTPNPDLSEHNEEAIPFADVMRKLLDAKPAPKREPARDDEPKPEH